MNGDEYPEVRGELIQRKTEISDADLQYRTRVDLEDPVRGGFPRSVTSIILQIWRN